MAVKLIIGKDINGVPTFDIPVSDLKYSLALAASTEQTITVPAGYTRVFYAYEPGTKIWIANSTTAITLPSGGTPTVTNAELNPNGRSVKVGDILRFKTSDTTAEVGAVFYA